VALVLSCLVSSALIKMGDLYYEGHVAGHKDVVAAAQRYKRAALLKDPQVVTPPPHDESFSRHLLSQATSFRVRGSVRTIVEQA